MPYASNAGASLYWETGGSGEPLLLIQGLGWSADMWFRLLPEIGFLLLFGVAVIVVALRSLETRA